MPRGLALLICLIGLMTIVSLAVAIVVPPFTKEFQELLIQIPVAAKKLSALALGTIEKTSMLFYGDNAAEGLDQNFFLSSFKAFTDSPNLATGISEGIESLLGFVGNLGTTIIRLLFVLAIALMIAIQPIAYREISLLLLPSFYRRRANLIIQQCGEALNNWMIGVLISSLCVALLSGIGLSILGVKLVMANALLAGLLNIIPNLGPTISTIFPLSVALLDAPWKALAVIGLYIFIQNLESYIITPSVMQHQVKLLPGLTLTAQFVFTIIFGPLGLLLSLPLAVVIQVIVREAIVHDLLDPWKNNRVFK